LMAAQSRALATLSKQIAAKIRELSEEQGG
jgi:hypothetical protein